MENAKNMQRARLSFQVAFLALTVFAVWVVGANAERWCPFGGVEALKTYVTDGTMTCSLGVSNFYALGGLLLAVLVVRRAFCSHVCPIGALGEWFGRLGKRLRIKPARVPQALDRGLSLLKYGVLTLILYVTWNADELLFRTADPCYALLSRHGEDITFWAYVVTAVILLGALFVSIPFCRWLCPLAAVMNPLSRFGLMRVRRDGEACVDCRKCEAVCPMNIAVSRVPEVTAARCTACLECVSVCPPKIGPALTVAIPGTSGRRWSHAALIGVLLIAIGSVVTVAYALPIASFVKSRGEPPATGATVELEVHGLHCRGTGTLLTYFLFRDDVFELTGYLQLEAWPEPGSSRVRVTYDPKQTDEASIKEAIVTPYFDELHNTERESPFEIEGYAPWAMTGPRPDTAKR